MVIINSAVTRLPKSIIMLTHYWLHCAAFKNFFSKVKDVLTVSNLIFCAELKIATRFLQSGQIFSPTHF